MSDDLRDRLRGIVARWAGDPGEPLTPHQWDEIGGGFRAFLLTRADLLLAELIPVVLAERETYAAQRAAEALRAAAEWLEGVGDGPAAPDWPEALPRADVALMLRDRAADDRKFYGGGG